MPTVDHAGHLLSLSQVDGQDEGKHEGAADSEDDGEDMPPVGTTARRRARRRRGLIASALVVVIAVAGGVVWWAAHRITPPILAEGCTAVAGGRTVTLDAEQAGNAAIITAVAVRRNLPARAATIALATALQESKLRNLTYGDRDSLGLFQQRPSAGWGTKAQVTNPVYASNSFYNALVKIKDYQTIPVTKAAQKVQHSAFPSAYAGHEADARVLASALTGFSPAALTCVFGAATAGIEQPAPSGMTPRAAALARAAQRELGATVTETGAKGTSLELHLPSASATSGWAIAQWAVARGGSLQVVAVGTAGQSWSRTDHPNRWAAQQVAGLAPGHVIVQVS